MPTGILAQSPQDAPRSLPTPTFHLDFGLVPGKADAVVADPSKVKVVGAQGLSKTSQPVDCEMVRAVDPQVHDVMPIVTPRTGITYRTALVPPPSSRRLSVPRT